MHWEELDSQAKDQLSAMFAEKVFPILTPLAVDPAHPFPYISGLSLNLAVVVRNPVSDKELFARVKVPDQLPRLISIDGARAGSVPGRVARFIALEEVIAVHLDQLFAGMEVLEHHTFRVTRNEDVEVEEDDAENLLQALEKELLRRRFGPPVRLEVTNDINPNIRALLIRELGVEESEVYSVPAPLDLRGLSVIAGIDRADLHYPKHVPHTSRYLNESETSKAANVFAAMRRRDILLHHPYDSFSTSVQAFLEQAAADPKVQAIKQTLYRTSGDSPIVDALIDAAEAGKQVLALVEIKARFDEQANISWARKLEQAGVHVVYGIVGLKTHCKLSLVVRQEVDGLRRYCHIGTGNYHPRTARYYEDLGLLTANEQVGEDLSKLFNQLSGYAPKSTFKRLLVAPRSVRSGLIDRIETEIRNARAGIAARVQIKVNSMVDEAIIDSLYRASQAGVQVDVIVRGICSLRPGVPGLSENITVRSVLGRFLEHSRVFAFANAGDPVVYIGSADMMHRNLDRRVEALVQLDQRRRHELCPGLAQPLHGARNRQLAFGQAGRMDPPPPGRRRPEPQGRPVLAARLPLAPALDQPAVGTVSVSSDALVEDQTDHPGEEVAVTAAGAIPWRLNSANKDQLEVLLIHRPRYDDWSWPKGKIDPGETIPECAVREVEEEIGLTAPLGIPLPPIHYHVAGRAEGGPLLGGRRRRRCLAAGRHGSRQRHVVPAREGRPPPEQPERHRTAAAPRERPRPRGTGDLAAADRAPREGQAPLVLVQGRGRPPAGRHRHAAGAGGGAAPAGVEARADRFKPVAAVRGHHRTVRQGGRRQGEAQRGPHRAPARPQPAEDGRRRRGAVRQAAGRGRCVRTARPCRPS